MSRRRIALSLLVVVNLVCLAGLVWSVFGTSRLTFTQTEIQDRLNRHLPRVIKGVTVERVDVALADDRLSLQASLRGQVVRQTVAALVSARGAPRYDAGGHEIYFDADSIAFERIAIAGRAIPRGDEARNPLVAAAVATSEQIAEQAIRSYLATLPVYRFKDDFKGYVLKAALTDVTVAGDRLVVDLSLWKLTATTATFAFWLVVGVAALLFLLRFPIWSAAAGVSIGDL